MRTRRLYRADWPEVLLIERLTMRHPFGQEHLLTLLSHRDTVSHVVEAADGRVVGYLIYSRRRHRFALCRLCVHPDYQRFGYGSELVRQIVRDLFALYPQRAGILTLVPDYNLDAQLFFKACGFHGHLIECFENRYAVEFTWDAPAESGVCR